MGVEIPVLIEAKAVQVRGRWDAVVALDGHVVSAQGGFVSESLAYAAATAKASQLRSELHAAIAQSRAGRAAATGTGTAAGNAAATKGKVAGRGGVHRLTSSPR